MERRNFVETGTLMGLRPLDALAEENFGRGDLRSIEGDVENLGAVIVEEQLVGCADQVHGDHD
jgi:hypothetical protein